MSVLLRCFFLRNFHIHWDRPEKMIRFGKQNIDDVSEIKYVESEKIFFHYFW